ncbi:MAG: hypothetical protein WCR92_08935 [Candidatus Cloacimonadaceae bacterium]
MDVRFCYSCQKKMPFVAGLCARCRGREGEQPGAEMDANNTDETPKMDRLTESEKWRATLLLLAVISIVVWVSKASQQQAPPQKPEETVEQREERHIRETRLNLERMIRARLRDPDSYQQISAVTLPSPEKGVIGLVVHYRAKNGFGGYTNGFASGNCDMTARNCKILRMQ